MSSSATQLVPYGAPTGAVTPPTLGNQPTAEQPAPSGQPAQDDPIKKLIAAMLQQKQQPQLAQPVPSPAQDPKQKQQIPMTKGWGFERFSSQVGGNIQTAIANKKKADLAKAEADWNQFSAAQQKGPEAAQLWLAQNEKAAKNMAKALNQDWLNPEKTTAHRQALDNVTKQQQAKSKAASGLQDMMKKLIGKAQNPQLTDEQKMAIAKEQMSKAPMTQPGMDKELMPLITEQMRAENEAQRSRETQASEDKRATATQKAESDRAAATQKAEGERNAATQKAEADRSAAVQKSDDARAKAERDSQMAIAKLHEHSEDLRSGNAKLSQLNSQLNSTAGSFKAQAAQLSANIRNLQNQKTKLESQNAAHWITGPGKSSIDDMQQQINDSQEKLGAINKSISDFNSKKGAILKMAKEDPDKAADMMDKLTQDASATALGGGTQSPASGGGSKTIVVTPQDMN